MYGVFGSMLEVLFVWLEDDCVVVVFVVDDDEDVAAGALPPR